MDQMVFSQTKMLTVYPTQDKKTGVQLLDSQGIDHFSPALIVWMNMIWFQYWDFHFQTRYRNSQNFWLKTMETICWDFRAWRSDTDTTKTLSVDLWLNSFENLRPKSDTHKMS